MKSEQSRKVTSTDIFLYLRQRLIDAREQNDMNTLGRLQSVFDILLDLAYMKKNQAIGKILEGFESSAAHSLMGVGWKSTIPSEEEIRLALQSENTD
jgi:hypothetical protein